MLEREGIVMNGKKLRRLHEEEGLAVRRRRGRKRATGTREPMPVPAAPGERWSLDVLSDVFGPGRRFRVLATIDDHTQLGAWPWSPTPRSLAPASAANPTR